MAEVNQPEPHETPTEEAIEGIRQGLHEALSEQTIPLADMWKDIDVEMPERVSGLLKGEVGDTFFEPLPEEILREWEE
ncbi:hypothetical protein XM38_037910 [Halomicronema hongdechloris C2206]|uniref:Uncharacterized protein n=1 Tax=Halomicronema hongdechloris C2206 TaxID=1641165 RepID=A0A1Z3HRF7_9CYAN|nr:hypothetical protein [Halomicronema hongdechloris]ASC72832.1 hypothetical protein XM38_037910 [Halomicronema hongdechloris C2206]